jgi:hypothetical protein
MSESRKLFADAKFRPFTASDLFSSLGYTYNNPWPRSNIEFGGTIRLQYWGMNGCTRDNIGNNKIEEKSTNNNITEFLTDETSNKTMSELPSNVTPAPPITPNQLNPVNNDPCPICYTEIKNTEEFITGCRHRFHISCIAQWRETNNSCPMCRNQLSYGRIIDLYSRPSLEEHGFLTNDNLPHNIVRRLDRLTDMELKMMANMRRRGLQMNYEPTLLSGADMQRNIEPLRRTRPVFQDEHITEAFRRAQQEILSNDNEMPHLEDAEDGEVVFDGDEVEEFNQSDEAN